LGADGFEIAGGFLFGGLRHGESGEHSDNQMATKEPQAHEHASRNQNGIVIRVSCARQFNPEDWFSLRTPRPFFANFAVKSSNR
jgi:hypothetical protein